MDTTDVLAIAQRYLHGVKKCGAENIMAFCPFHDNRHTPSFSMSLTKGLFLCFSCKETGTLRTFLRKMEVIPDPYEFLLNELDTQSKDRKDRDDDVHLLQNEPLPESLLGLFQYVPVELEEEGFEEHTLQLFDVGVDMMHERITYPLRNWKGDLIGISGRARMEGASSRYKIYEQEYLDFQLPKRKTNKSEVLWNYDRLFPKLYPEKNSRIIVVEGFKSVMWLHQNGFPHVIATLGSFLSSEQHWLLEHLGAEVVLMFDNDEAGLKGTQYAGKKLSASLQVRIAQFDSEFHQPTDIPPDQLFDVLVDPPDWFSWKLSRSS